MKRAVRLTLTAGAVALVCACTSDSLNPPFGRPLASLSDGAHSGNPDFFFLPPIFKNPSSDPNFTAGAFNANVRPTVEICELGALVPPSLIRPCAATIKTFAASDIQLDVSGEQYAVNWDTRASNLDVTKDYRIRVLLGPNTLLGFADVDLVSTGSSLRRVDTGELIGLVDGRTLPIKFRVENGAACNGGACNSKTIDLSRGGFVVLATTGDRVDIPAQQSGQVVTVTVQLCAGLDVDLPLFGNCLRATADPPLAARLSPAATVSICSLSPLSLPPHPQQDLVTLHRQDGAVVLALPHSTDFCTPVIGRSQRNAPSSLVARGWRALRDVAVWMFKPATAHASTMMFDVGAGGQTDGFSDFQFALPAKMEITSVADQTGLPNTPVTSVPAVLVTDALGHPVAGARVHFQITSGSGSSILPAAGIATSDDAGHAALTQWTLGAAGSFAVQAYGKGIAVRGNDGPAEGFDPFTPAIFHVPGEDEAQAPVQLGTGRLTFNATAGAPDLIVQSLTHLPLNPTDADLTEYTAVVRNVGTAPADRFTIQVNVNENNDGSPGRLIATTSLTTATILNPGETVSLHRLPTLQLAAGSFINTAIADVAGQVAESNEGNNTLTDLYTVAAATRTALLECLGDPSGDQIDRGFYIPGSPGFPGTVLSGATMSFSADVAGTYTLSLTARAGGYGGPVLGTATTQVTLTADRLANVPATFQFAATQIPQFVTVAFSLAIVDGPSNIVFYSVPNLGSPSCPVVQTEGTTPPLDTFRRQGVGIRFDGSAPIVVTP